MYLEIITPDKKVYQGDVDAVRFPGSAGSFEVMRNHAPLISTLQKGNIRIRKGKEVTEITVGGGLVEVLKDTITVLASTTV
jgi:F-type H+-transporting ATPase subunit epsilon